LRTVLDALPTAIATRLATAVEADKSNHESGLPHDVILEILQPKLANGYGTREAATLGEIVISEVDQLARGAGLRLHDDHANLVEIVGWLLERAPHEIAKALPARARGSFATIRLPDLSKQTSPELKETAMRYARLIAASRTDSRVTSLADELADCSRSVLSGLRSYAADMVREKRAAVPARASVVEALFSTTLELVIILFGKAEADALRRRAQTADAYTD
jgi:hypothetical protein